MRSAEALTDYLIDLKDKDPYSLDFIYTIIALFTLPFIVIMLIGALFYIGFIAIGYFILLSLISPSTAEKMIKGAIKSYRDTGEKEV